VRKTRFEHRLALLTQAASQGRGLSQLVHSRTHEPLYDDGEKYAEDEQEHEEAQDHENEQDLEDGQDHTDEQDLEDERVPQREHNNDDEHAISADRDDYRIEEIHDEGGLINPEDHDAAGQWRESQVSGSPTDHDHDKHLVYQAATDGPDSTDRDLHQDTSREADLNEYLFESQADVDQQKYDPGIANSGESHEAAVDDRHSSVHEDLYNLDAVPAQSQIQEVPGLDSGQSVKNEGDTGSPTVVSASAQHDAQSGEGLADDEITVPRSGGVTQDPKDDIDYGESVAAAGQRDESGSAALHRNKIDSVKAPSAYLSTHEDDAEIAGETAPDDLDETPQDGGNALGSETQIGREGDDKTVETRPVDQKVGSTEASNHADELDDLDFGDDDTYLESNEPQISGLKRSWAARAADGVNDNEQQEKKPRSE